MGSQVAYWERPGPGGGVPLVLLHGFRGNHRALLELARHLPERRLILMDLPGYGASTPLNVPHTLDNYVLALEELVRRLELGPFDLWGHSFGGTLALMLAGRTQLPLRRLVLVAPALRPRGPWARLIVAYYRAASFMPEWLRRLWLASRLFALVAGWVLVRTPQARRRRQLFAAEQRNLAEFRSQVVIESFVSFYTLPVATFAPAITIPTLVIAGREDELVPLSTLKTWSQNLPHAQLEVLDHAGHLAPLERPQVAARLTEAFLLAE